MLSHISVLFDGFVSLALILGVLLLVCFVINNLLGIYQNKLNQKNKSNFDKAQNIEPESFTTLKGLFLDDLRNPKEVTWIDYPTNVQWDVVRTPSEFIKNIDETKYDVISFDHDLAAFEKHEDGDVVETTGYDLLKLLVGKIQDECENGQRLNTEFALRLPCLYFHSQNPTGIKNMSQYWYNFRKHIRNDFNIREYVVLNNRLVNFTTMEQN